MVGADAAPRKMTAAEVKELGDPFATLLLARGKFPRSGEEVVDGDPGGVRKGDPLKTLRTFVVGEGSQLARGDSAGGRPRRCASSSRSAAGRTGPTSS